MNQTKINFLLMMSNLLTDSFKIKEIDKNPEFFQISRNLTLILAVRDRSIQEIGLFKNLFYRAHGNMLKDLSRCTDKSCTEYSQHFQVQPTQFFFYFDDFIIISTLYFHFSRHSSFHIFIIFLRSHFFQVRKQLVIQNWSGD